MEEIVIIIRRDGRTGYRWLGGQIGLRVLGGLEMKWSAGPWWPHPDLRHVGQVCGGRVGVGLTTNTI